MGSHRRKESREKDLTAKYLAGDVDEDRVEKQQRFTTRSKQRQQNKIEQTTLMREAEREASGDVEQLPVGQVIQMHSLFCEVEHEKKIYLCVVRKTLTKVSETAIVVGDLVKFRATGTRDEAGREEAVIEQVLERKTVVARAQSFKGINVQPIVANAEQMLIVASLRYPEVKWGLIDRMIVAASSGGLLPILCLNKVDLAEENPRAVEANRFAKEALSHYQSIGIVTLQTSAVSAIGLDSLRHLLQGRTTVLAGHSGVGKSSLIQAIQPGLDIRIGEISHYTEKGRHTTTSTRRYELEMGGAVIDTPGIKQFGLWGVGQENLLEYFPDVENGTAPQWRVESYHRIAESLA